MVTSINGKMISSPAHTVCYIMAKYQLQTSLEIILHNFPILHCFLSNGMTCCCERLEGLEKLLAFIWWCSSGMDSIMVNSPITCASEAIFAAMEVWQHEANKLWAAHTLIGLWIHSRNDETSSRTPRLLAGPKIQRIKKLSLFCSKLECLRSNMTRPEGAFFSSSLKLLTAWSSRFWQTILSMQSKQKVFFHH